MVVLQCLCNLHSASTIAVGLDHADHLRLWLQERAVVVQVLYHSIEIHLENRFVHLLLQLLRNLIETEVTGPLQQDEFIAQACEDLARKEMLHIGIKELLVDADSVCLGRQFRPDTNKFLHTTLHTEVAHLRIKSLR